MRRCVLLLRPRFLGQKGRPIVLAAHCGQVLLFGSDAARVLPHHIVEELARLVVERFVINA